MLTRLQLRNVGPARELSLDLSPRINLLTGDNGLGKSFLLDAAWWALTRTWSGTPAQPRPDSQRHHDQDGYLDASITWNFPDQIHEARFHLEGQEWKEHATRAKQTDHPGDGVVIYARADGGFSVWDAARNPGRHTRTPSFHFTRQQLWDGLKDNGQVLCSGLIDDWVLWQSRKNGAFEQLCAVLRELSPSPAEPILPGEPARISLNDVRDFPTLHMPYGQDVPVTHASAGMKRVVAMAYLLVWAWREHTAASKLLRQPVTKQITFLIDEVEAHLHPRWQRTIMPALLQVVDKLTDTEQVPTQIIAASHSPLLLASLEPIFDPQQDTLWKLDLEDGRVVLERDAWHKRGDASAWLRLLDRSGRMP